MIDRCEGYLPGARRTRYGWTENERITREDDYMSNGVWTRRFERNAVEKPFSVCRETVRHRAAMIGIRGRRSVREFTREENVR